MTSEEREAPDTDSVAEDWQRAQAELRALGQSVGTLTEELGTLLRREQDLARAELADTKAAAAKVGIWATVALLSGVLALAFLCVAIMFGLAVFVPLWAAALVTTALLLLVVVAGALMAKRQLTDLSVVPKRTLRSLQEDVRWAVERTKRSAA